MSVFFSFSSHYLHHTTKANHIVCHFSGDKQPIDQISLPNTLKLNKQAKATYSSLSQKKSKQYHSKQIYGINPLCMKKNSNKPYTYSWWPASHDAYQIQPWYIRKCVNEPPVIKCERGRNKSEKLQSYCSMI